MPRYKSDLYIGDCYVQTYFVEAPNDDIANEILEEMLDNYVMFDIEEIDD